MADLKGQKPHAILIPYPLQGHVNPFTHLALNLASKGFTITFVNTQSTHHCITKSSSQSRLENANAADDNHYDTDMFAAARRSGLDIRYATVSDGLPLGFDRSLNHDQFFECILHVFSAHVDELVGNLMKSDPSINCLIADSFYVWPVMICKKYKLVNISFWTEPALVLTLYYHKDLLKKNGHYDCLDNREDIIDYIPGVRSIKPTDLTSYLQASDTSTPVHRIIHKGIFQEAKKADFMLCNTVQELESSTISALGRTQPFFAIGPIFSFIFSQKPVSTSLWSEFDCTHWLDGKPPGSVLYASFGSYAHTTKQVIVEIANGILKSNVNFIWVLRPDIVSVNETDFLPIGFEDQVKGRGLIVPWCNQKAVLSHPSIGGFLTHCGWNSILESIWCEVPFICFPLLTDQFTNRKLLVDDWNIGINLCDRRVVDREQVAKNIDHLMTGKKSDELRNEIKKVKKKLEEALAMGGSSQRNFDHFIDEVKVKISAMK